jgi:IS30 family transposase
MAQMGRPGLSASQKAELWHQWKCGQSLSDIGLALGKHAGSIHCVVASNGGIVPAARKRSPVVLTMSEREEICRGIAAGASIRQIAARASRSPSTVSREIARHGGRHCYRAAEADAEAWGEARRPKPCRLAIHPRLQRIVANKLSLDWSPEQVAGWLKLEFPDDESMRVSHETIYRSLFIQARGVLKKELIGHLRSKRMMRRSKNASTDGQPRGQIVDGVSIRELPLT